MLELLTRQVATPTVPTTHSFFVFLEVKRGLVKWEELFFLWTKKN